MADLVEPVCYRVPIAQQSSVLWNAEVQRGSNARVARRRATRTERVSVLQRHQNIAERVELVRNVVVGFRLDLASGGKSLRTRPQDLRGQQIEHRGLINAFNRILPE